MDICFDYLKTPVGEIILGSYNNELVMADWRYRKMRGTIDKRISSILKAEFKAGVSKVNEQAKTQLLEYFAKERTVFELPLKMVGTPFQLEVWRALQEIPFGTTSSYKKLSQKLNNEGAIRAVASANGANALSIIVPCHRIIGSNGDLVGYAGGLPAKKKLLMLENALQIPQLDLFD